MEPIIKTENIKVIYNKGQDNQYIALNDISIEVFPEEYLIFFGPSGCGKSTLLYTILGLQKLSEGKLYIKGKDSASFSEAEKRNMDSQFFGIVFQNFNLIYSLNVLDNITLPQVFIEADQEARKAKAHTLLARFGIETRAKNLPASLSGGQQQRVAICRSLVNDPVVLLADEPVGNLDSESARIVMETLWDINKKDKKTVILVTHDPSYLPFADRIYYFKDAKLEKVVKNANPQPMHAKPNETPQSQGQDTPLGELEKMARAHNFMTVPQLKAWSVTNYLTDEFTVNQLERLEKCMEEILAGELSEHQFFERLNMPYSDGGVGLYRGTAIRFVRKISSVLKEVKEFLQHLKISKDPEKNAKLVDMLRKFLLEEYRGTLKEGQIELLEKGINDRLLGAMSAAQFSVLLDKPFAEGGVGLNSLTAEHLSERLEIILAQAYEVS
ncbi:MAG: ABC transporter ATP-binding protein [Candidatus Magasanikbacteria bacterium]|nr:ABC transporter ATP-binding protein [Candidatus Magasanikbacteria bacterium]